LLPLGGIYFFLPEVSITNEEDFPVVPVSIPTPETVTVEGSSFPFDCWGPTTSLNGEPGM